MYAGGSYGLHGYIFCDLLTHEYLAPYVTRRPYVLSVALIETLWTLHRARGDSGEAPKPIKATVNYTPLEQALQHKWSGLTRRQTKEVNPALAFAILGRFHRCLHCSSSAQLSEIALWQYQSLHNDQLPSALEAASELEGIANSLIAGADVNKQILTRIPRDIIEYELSQLARRLTKSTFSCRSLSTTATHEFSPVCAIVGGMLGQDILKALGGRDPPIANLFIFDGSTGSGTTIRMNMA